MIKKITGILSFFFYFWGGSQIFAEISTNEKAEDSAEITHVSKATETDETMIELRSLRNPFTAQLPQLNEVKLPLEEEPPPQLDFLPDPVSDHDNQEVVSPPADIYPIETKQEITPPSFAILGLVWNTAKPQAIINNAQGNKIISVGDSIDTWEVLLINQSGIEIGIEGRTIFVSSGFGSNEYTQN